MQVQKSCDKFNNVIISSKLDYRLTTADIRTVLALIGWPYTPDLILAEQTRHWIKEEAWANCIV